MLLKNDFGSIFDRESNETKNIEVALTAKELKKVKILKNSKFDRKLKKFGIAFKTFKPLEKR